MIQLQKLDLNTLTALSPLDGRYASRTNALRAFFSEFALIQARVVVEVEWIIHLSIQSEIQEVPRFSDEACVFLRNLYKNFSIEDGLRVKKIESTTNHDVKAVEYFLKEKIQNDAELSKVTEFIHFACTSEDINNLSHALTLKNARDQVLLPEMKNLVKTLFSMANQYAAQPMLARTHGQSASPTTMGKELINVVARMKPIIKRLEVLAIRGKINGAVGNFNAHVVAYPKLNWPDIAQTFVEQLKLDYQAYSTQIEPHDYIAEFCQGLTHFNTVLMDLNRDIWSYIAIGYFKQKVVAGEVGSSTMPHKVNPIDFENSEGNLGLANAMLNHLAEKLPISRWQRDLSDSTVMRNLGVGVAYTLIALQSTQKGLTKLDLNTQALNTDLDNNWQVLAEPIQTVMRRYGIEEPYEKLKALTQGKHDLTTQAIRQFVSQLDIPDEAKEALMSLTPADYIGNAIDAVESYSLKD